MPTPGNTRMMFNLLSTRDSINRVTDIVSAACSSHNLPEDMLFDIKLAVQEAVVNAVEHGNRCDPDRMIYVTCEADDERLVLCIRDEGDGFDPCDIPDPTLPENILKEHGRGIFLMRSLCDEVRYSPKGNEVTLVKCFPRSKPQK